MPKTKTDPLHKNGKAQRRGFIVTNIVLSLLLVFCAVSFAVSYQRLVASIQKERTDSVEQIAALITDKVAQLRSAYLGEIVQLSRVIEHADASSIEALSYLQTGKNRFALVDEAGTYTLLDGSALLVDDPELLDGLLLKHEAGTSFAAVKTQGDSWLFSAPLNDTVIGGRTYIGVVLIVDGQEYADAATITLYDRLGESLVVARDGSVKMRPSAVNERALSGYNILSILRNGGVSEEHLAAFSAALRELQEYSFSCELDGVTWIIRTVPSDSSRNIVVAVPVSLTARSTYEGMNATLGRAVAALLVLLLLFLLNFARVLRKNQQIQLENVRAKSRSDFLAKMSHDIRTPMTAIVGMNELALQSFDDRELVHDCLVKAKRSSSYLVSVINDVLDMSRIESGKMTLAREPFDLREQLESVIQIELPAAEEKKVTLVQDLRLAGETCYGDAQRLRQCVVNLVSNAVKFTPSGGRVTVSCTAEHTGPGRILAVLTVADNGVGMSEEFQKKLFKPFEQEQNSMVSANAGSGLGLSIVHEFVRLMGGTVTVASRKDEGSAFTIRLPLELAPQTAAEEPAISDEELRGQLAGKRILLVEDNEINRQILSMLIEKFSLTVEQAENGRIAVDKFSASAPDSFSMIFMDIMMPVMGGLEACTAIRALDRADAKTVPIVALSANAFEEDAKKSLQAGMQAHLAKPVDTEELKRVLKKYIV